MKRDERRDEARKEAREWVDENGLYCIECPYCKKVMCCLNKRIARYDLNIHLKFCRGRRSRAGVEA